jgi:hypothetical protein
MQAVYFPFAVVVSLVVELALVDISASCDNAALYAGQTVNTPSENGRHSVFAEPYTGADQDSVVAVAEPSHCGAAHR